METGAKVVTFQKAMSRLAGQGVSPQDVAAAFQLQKALKAQGCSPEAIVEAVKQLIGRSILGTVPPLLLSMLVFFSFELI